jgi:hypothetical protein
LRVRLLEVTPARIVVKAEDYGDVSRATERITCPGRCPRGSARLARVTPISSCGRPPRFIASIARLAADATEPPAADAAEPPIVDATEPSPPTPRSAPAADTYALTVRADARTPGPARDPQMSPSRCGASSIDATASARAIARRLREQGVLHARAGDPSASA